MYAVSLIVASGSQLSAQFPVTGATGALALLVDSGTLGAVRMDFAQNSGGPWFTYQSAGAPFSVTSGGASAGVCPVVLGKYARVNLSAAQVSSKGVHVSATRLP